MIDGLRKQGVTIFLTTHHLEEAERLCDRVAIMNTTLRRSADRSGIARQVISQVNRGEDAHSISRSGAILDGLLGVESWKLDGPGLYVVSVTDPTVAAPEVTRALVRAGADVMSLVETRHSLEEVYLELIDEQSEVNGE